MIGLVSPANLTRQSQQPSVSRSNPLARGLGWLWCGSVPGRDLIGNGTYTRLSSTDLALGTSPVGRKANGAANSGWRFVAPTTGPSYTVFAVIGDNVGRGAARNTFDSDTGGGSSRIFQFGLNSSNQTAFIPFNMGGSPFFANSAAASSANGLTVICVTVDANQVATAWMNGQPGTPTTITGTPRGLDPTQTICVGNLNDLGSPAAAPFGGDIYLGGVYNRALSAAEISALTANPWQLLQAPARRWAAVVAGSGTSYSYTASGGMVLSGSVGAVRGRAKTGSGGLQTGGAASTARGAIRTATGGVLFAGAASQAKGKAFTGAGGLTMSGTAAILRGVARSTSGGLLFAGDANVSFFSAVQSLVVNPVGGIVFAGAALAARGVRKAAAGGVAFAGHATTVYFPPLVGALSSLLPEFIRRRRR